MCRRNLRLAEKGIRHAAKTRARRHRAIESDAGDAEARSREFAEPCKTLRQARSRFGALDRSIAQQELDGTGCRPSTGLGTGLAPNEHDELVKARDAALAAIHSFADELEKRMPKMVDFAPMGEPNYNYYLKHVLLLPLDAREVEMIGRVENARYRALEALLTDPKLADPDPKRAASIPPDQESFLKAYESRQTEMINFLKEHKLVTIPDYLGPFQIRQLPDAFKPTSPGGFMNPPGVYDKDPMGFFSFRLTIRRRRIFTSVPRSKIRDRFLVMKEFRTLHATFDCESFD